METETGHCKSCGNVVYEFSKKTATSDGSSYCVKCAEQLDSQYLKRNICSVCVKLLDREEIKFVMPSRMYSGYFFDRLPMENRLMCASCYIKAEKMNLIGKPLMKIEHIKARLKNGIIKRAIAKRILAKT